MAHIGKVLGVWRYPVKGMRGEELREGFLSFAGVYGDRMYAFRSPAAPPGFPYHTAREQEDLLLYQPRFRSEGVTKPPNLEEASAMAPGITPVFAERAAFSVDVTGPDGSMMPIESPDLLADVRKSRDDGGDVVLAFSERPMTDCRPISIFNVATAQQLGREIDVELDIRRFRANLYIELDQNQPFAENETVGRTLQLGDKAVVTILERDPRCKMIGLDPETADHNPRILQHLTQAHEGHAGLYAAVLVEGVVRQGDPITLQSRM
jgi:uncharacterized protein YcbX